MDLVYPFYHLLFAVKLNGYFLREDSFPSTGYQTGAIRGNLNANVF